MSGSPSVKKISDFGVMPDGSPVARYVLDNGRGVRMEVIALGGIVTRLEVPDKAGRSANITLGPTSVEQVLKTSPYLGALIGRVGNRIGYGRFELNGKTYTLAQNDGKHTLHGGRIGYDKRLWTLTPASDGSASLTLTLSDPDGTEGFPGTVQVRVVYTLTPTNAWRIEYSATTDQATPINLTQHAYFNLKDAGRSSVLDHVLRVDAADYTPSDATLLPSGEVAKVAGTPFDYTTPKPIGRDFAQLDNTPRGVDHNYVINGAKGTLRSAAEVHEPTTGRVMQVFTTEPAMQVYTGNFLDGTFTGTDGICYAQHTGFCLETQHAPNSVNQPNFPSTILEPGQTYQTTTEYRFSTR
ncbi:MAG: aldose epimerase family protein [Tepidisphaeraceae bacterium]